MIIFFRCGMMHELHNIKLPSADNSVAFVDAITKQLRDANYFKDRCRLFFETIESLMVLGKCNLSEKVFTDKNGENHYAYIKSFCRYLKGYAFELQAGGYVVFSFNDKFVLTLGRKVSSMKSMVLK